MSRKKGLIGLAVVVVLALATVLAISTSSEDDVSAETEVVERRNLVSTVSSSGNIRARRQVDISSDISARVISMDVQEGQDVTAGQVLIQLDRTQFEAALQRARASLSQAKAQYTQVTANQLRAQRNYERTSQLRLASPPIVSQQEFEEAETALEVAQANLESSGFGVEQAEAGVDEAVDRLSKTTIVAPIDGKVTRLNVEEGETVVVGTMNNPGSLVLSISDLSVMELVVQVDETDVPRLAIGDSATVEIDAFPENSFTGSVTQIGNSAIRPPSNQGGTQQAAIDFEVVITIANPGVELRPDLSATAEIVTEVRRDAVAVPIIALTIRDRAALESLDIELPALPEDADAEEGQDVEGVFVVRDGVATFAPVVVGITGREHFEILSGIEPGDVVVSGPYQTIRDLRSGDRVRGETEPDEPDARS